MGVAQLFRQDEINLTTPYPKKRRSLLIIRNDLRFFIINWGKRCY